ncbi:MAG: hypothetical protein GXP01_01335 [Alphaproteobacteria bacterium]|nr:hypothetical protein [Alphaproteobacteria bacterium]
MQLVEQQKFVDALAEHADQPAATFGALCDLADKVVGHILFTLTAIDRKTGGASRIYSNMPAAYPTFGTKPGNVTDWHRLVIDQRRTFVANSLEGIAEVFDDYELIGSLGCRSVINIPVTVAGRVIGTINCLAGADHYSASRVAASEALKLPGAMCFLLHARTLDPNQQMRG